MSNILRILSEPICFISLFLLVYIKWNDYHARFLRWYTPILGKVVILHGFRFAINTHGQFVLCKPSAIVCKVLRPLLENPTESDDASSDITTPSSTSLSSSLSSSFDSVCMRRASTAFYDTFKAKQLHLVTTSGVTRKEFGKYSEFFCNRIIRIQISQNEKNKQDHLQITSYCW